MIQSSSFDVLKGRFALRASPSGHRLLPQVPPPAIGAVQLPLQNVRATLADEVTEAIAHGIGLLVRPERLEGPETRAVPGHGKEGVKELVIQDEVSVPRPLLCQQQGVDLYASDFQGPKGGL